MKYLVVHTMPSTKHASDLCRQVVTCSC